MHVYFVSSKVTLKCAGSLSVEARGSQAAQREENFKIFLVVTFSSLYHSKSSYFVFPPKINGEMFVKHLLCLEN